MSEPFTAIRVEQFTDARRGRPLWMRALNAAGRLAPGFARPSADAWWEEARRAEPTCGEPSAPAREALAVLAESIGREARLNLIGRFSAREDTVRMARTHLRVQRALRENPAIAQTELPAPIFVIGWPRTGTTFLHQLLYMDPATRTIPYWESFDPVPPASGPDRRAAKVDRMLAQLAQISPAYQAIHPMSAEGAEECVALFMNELRSLQYDIQYRAPSYVAWLLAQDAGVAYGGYRRQLQLIQHHRPHGQRFVLKDPTHLVHLETVLALFPDAKVVFTHRDPAFTISSICSLYAHTRAIFTDEVDPHALGREIMSGYWPAALDRAQEIPARLAPARYVDVRHGDLARDPIGTVARLYGALGIEFTEAARAAMEAFLVRETRQPKRAHEHSPEGFGLRGEAIRERFAAYVSRFAL